MIIIADAGATSTSWRIIHVDGQIMQENTGSFNLVHSKIDDYLVEVESKFRKFQLASHVHFYTAGYINSSKYSTIFSSGLHAIFPNAQINLASDLLGAARGLCGDQPGLVGILGTGSNLAHYDGHVITRRIPSLGYILGDEGSGSYMGKQILVDFLRGKMPADIESKFNQTFQLTEEEVIKYVYQNQEVKSFLGKFTYFLKENINHHYCYQLVYHAFIRYFNAYLLTEKPINQTINFSGSVAYEFTDILRKAGADLNLHVGLIVASPIAGLTLYYLPK
jgi:N-acetylglucosamine kinase-like BadF-type ATPase